MNIQIYTITDAQLTNLVYVHKLDLEDEELAVLVKYAKFAEPLLAAFYGEELLCFFGFVPETLLSDKAHIWVYTTDAVKQHKIIFARESAKVVVQMQEVYSTITGYCMTKSAVRWLLWVGAKFKPALGTVYPFEIRRA